MYKKHTVLFFLIASLLVIYACSTVSGGGSATEAPVQADVPAATESPVTEEPATEAPATEAPVGEVPATESPAITDETSAVCMTSLEAMLNEEGESGIPADAPEFEEEYVLVTYQVSGDEISSPEMETDVPEELVSYQEDTARHQELWKFYTDLIPANQRTMIGEFIIFSDGVDGTIGAVDEANNPDEWTLEIDVIDAMDLGMLSTTLVHEFAHILTLGDDQLDENAAVCPVYETLDGCSRSDSYINDFYNAFWTDIYAEWESTVLVDDEVDEDMVYEFYDQYPDQFVSDYAPTGPEEDIAETWIYFVFGEKPAGDTIAEEKILFFYNYPELVKLRQQILNGMCPYTE
jgi:hypothetical protein